MGLPTIRPSRFRMSALTGLLCAALGSAATAQTTPTAPPAAPAAPPAAAPAAPAVAPVKLGIVAFLTGPAAGPFGIPGRNAAEIMIEMINAGKVPDQYASVGLGGAKIEPKFLDENGSSAAQVTEYRNLIQRDGMDAVVGYISSGNCLAVAPVAEELKALTVFFDCGTPRIFEEKPLKYVFRPTPHATMDSVGAARYALKRFPELASYSGINQNYAWGQDSWRDFVAALKSIAPKAKADKELFPKLFAGEYGAEISALLTASSQVVHSSFWNGDLESFIVQNAARGLPARSTMLYASGEPAMFRMGPKLPDGTIIGARGLSGVMAPDTPLNKWFRQVYEDRFGTVPLYPSYHMAQSILGLKSAWDKAAAKAGKRPTNDEIIAAFEGLEFEGPSGTVKMAIGNGHQGIAGTAYGTYKFNKAEGKAEIVDIVRYPAECVNPPANMTSTAWLEAGMPGAKCN
jgi:branched-chain amino acid transport system substrate-binding protein